MREIQKLESIPQPLIHTNNTLSITNKLKRQKEREREIKSDKEGG